MCKRKCSLKSLNANCCTYLKKQWQNIGNYCTILLINIINTYTVCCCQPLNKHVNYRDKCITTNKVLTDEVLGRGRNVWEIKVVKTQSMCLILRM